MAWVVSEQKWRLVFIRILLKFWEHLFDRPEQNTSSENNNTQYNAWPPKGNNKFEILVIKLFSL